MDNPRREWPGGFLEGDIVYILRAYPWKAGRVCGLHEAERIGLQPDAVPVRVEAWNTLYQSLPGNLILESRVQACPVCGVLTWIIHAETPMSRGRPPYAVAPACETCRGASARVEALLRRDP